MTTDDLLIDTVARRIANRIYRVGWDQLPDADQHSTRVLARLAIDDVRAAEYERPESPADTFHHTLDASLARAQLAVARGRLCSCGVARETCPEHRGAAAAVEEDA